MTHDEKINYMRIAAGICSFGFKHEDLDKLISLYELIIEKKGNADIHDIVKVEHDAKERAAAKNKQDLLDMVSTKTK